MLNGELTPRSNLIGELTGGVFYGTNDYEELINKPSINGVELKGNKTTSDLGINIPTELSELTNDVGFITSADVPTKTSDLTNDSGYITSADVSAVGISGDYDDLTNKPTIPTLTSQLTNDSGFITNAQVPTMTSQLFNDSGYITSSDIPTEVSAFTNDAGYITSADIPTEVSAFTNDAGYITSADIPTDVSAFTNDAGYISNSDLMTATASGSIATFPNGGDDIPVKSFECEIVAQQASGTPTPTSPLPITGFSQADIFNISDITNKKFFEGLLNGTYDYVDLGTLPWSEASAYFVSSGIASTIKILGANVKNNILSNKYETNTGTNIVYEDERGIGIGGGGNIIVSKLSEPSTPTGYLIYELATPTTPTITQAQFEMLCNAFGITGTLYTVAFGQTIYGGRLIYANGEWSIEATHKIEDLSTYAWTYWTYGVHNLFYNTVSDKINNVKNYVICSHFEAVNDSANSLNTADDLLVNDNSIIASYQTSEPRFMVRCDTYTDALSFKNGVNGYKVVYELATPTIIPITSSTRIKTISGENNIYSNTGDCEVEYFTNKADSLAELIKAFVV